MWGSTSLTGLRTTHETERSLFGKRLGIGWRLVFEFYELLFVDYDVCSNWGNWQYVTGVGNDPRGEYRVFN